MSKPQEFMLKLERQNLEDTFELVEQVLPIDLGVPALYFQKLLHKVNQLCKDKELFVIKVFCKVEAFLVVCRLKSTEQKFKLTIEHIVNFNNAIIENTPIIIE